MTSAPATPRWLSYADYAASLNDSSAAEEFGPLSAFPCVFVPLGVEVGPRVGGRALFWPSIVIGVDRDGILPELAEANFDILLTSCATPPPPWVGLPGETLDRAIDLLAQRVAQFPLASTTLAQVLRSGERQAFESALVLESLAYSTLLGGPEFRCWRMDHPVRVRGPERESFVRFAVSDCSVMITLTRVGAHNAFSARARDELADALRAAGQLPASLPIILSGEGPSFCSGGDLDEFGTAPDPATAHAIRLQRSCALLVHRVKTRIEARLHGYSIGAGIEIPAGAGRVIATPETRIVLPEVGMGLIPGAGGTVTLPRRIGRHRTCYISISGETIDLDKALNWRLVDAIVDDG